MLVRLEELLLLLLLRTDMLQVLLQHLLRRELLRWLALRRSRLAHLANNAPDSAPNSAPDSYRRGLWRAHRSLWRRREE